jgi:hypothetical protein
LHLRCRRSRRLTYLQAISLVAVVEAASAIRKPILAAARPISGKVLRQTAGSIVLLAMS